MTKHTIDDAISAYVELRDELAKLRQKHKEEEAAVKDKMAKFDSFFSEYLNKIGAEHIATKHGTVYKSMKTSATVADWELCFGFIKDHEMWDALDRRVNKTAVEDYMNTEKEPFPGVNYSTFETVNVRRS